MRKIVIASQLDDRFNRAFAEAVEDIEIIGVARGPALVSPPEAEVLFAGPFHRSGWDAAYPPPAGWPFGVKWVQLISAGVDLYPKWLFDGRVVTSARGVTSLALAEFALAAIFAAAKRMPEVWIDREAAWKPVPMSLVSGAALGLVGFGAISRALTPKAQALGMTVLATRRSDAALPAGVERLADAVEVFARCDHVVLACPATAQTEGMVNQALLAHAKPGLHLINLARGSLIDDEALLAALDSGRVSLATLDCASPEPLPDGHPFYAHPRVRLSPHTSTITPDSLGNLIDKFARNLARFRAGEPLEDVVDTEAGY
jgi:phosphoglycerate dehydrogenase-like enzyme